MFIWPGKREEAKAVSRAEPRCHSSLDGKWGGRTRPGTSQPLREEGQVHHRAEATVISE